jgi:hypothetical protein
MKLDLAAPDSCSHNDVLGTPAALLRCAPSALRFGSPLRMPFRHLSVSLACAAATAPELCHAPRRCPQSACATALVCQE